MTADQGGSGSARQPAYRQDITVASGAGYGLIGADMHVFADGVPLYLLANWKGADEAEPSWLRELPSRMLNARFAVVDFTGRRDELARLREWRTDGPRLAIQWLHAPGGTGKTRLAAQFAAESVAVGWKVVSAVRGPGVILPELPSQDLRPGGAAGLLLIVDYADQWPLTHLAMLLSSTLFAQSAVRTRILLLARTGDAWERVRAQLTIGAFAASSQFLEPLPAALPQRAEMFAVARDSFARRYGLADVSGLRSPVPLDHRDLDLTLAVHVAALVAVDAHDQRRPVPTDPASLTAYLLDREHDHWQRLHGDGTHLLAPAERAIATPPAVMSRIVFAAALAGPVPRAAGIGALRGLDDAPDPEPTLADHAVCYPPARQADDTVLEPLYPDRLAEDYLALTVLGHASHGYPAKPWAVGTGGALLARSAEGEAAAWTPRAITFLAAAAERWPRLGPRYLYPLLRADPRLAVDAGGAALTSLAHLPGTPVSLFEAIEPHLPADSDPDLDVGVAAVVRRLTEYRLARTSDPGERAWLYEMLARRMSRAGLRAEALKAAREAVRLSRSLASEDPHSFEPVLAASVGRISMYLAEAGQRKEALDAAMEAAALWQRLADADPDANGPGLAASLRDLGTALGLAGWHREALAAAETAVASWRRLAEKDPVNHRRWLADALLNFAVDLARAGQRASAAAHAEEALGIYRALAADSPATFGADTAHALSNLSQYLTGLGEHERALATAEEAVTISRRLAKASPAAREPGLGTALSELADCLSHVGRADEALLAAEEALEIRRALAAELPAAFDPDVAVTLHNVAHYQSSLGLREAALATAEQATQAWRRLAHGDPATFGRRLARALSGLAAHLAELGRAAEALAIAEEGVAIARRLAKEAPEVHSASLAMSLANLGGYLDRQGRPEQGLAAAEEAVGIYRVLADAYRAAPEPEYAIALNKLGLRHSSLGQHAQAASAIGDSAALYRRLAVANPAAFESELARVLRILSPELDQAGRREEAADAEQEAVTLLRRLASRDRATWERDLAGALSDLGASRLMQGRAAEAAALAEEAVTIFSALAASDPTADRAGLTIARRVLTAARSKRALSRGPRQGRRGCVSTSGAAVAGTGVARGRCNGSSTRGALGRLIFGWLPLRRMSGSVMVMDLLLGDIRVIDLTVARAGPTCVRQLADWGADVIRVEPPGEPAGDQAARDALGGSRHDSDFQHLHRNKRSLSLNLKSPAGREVLMRLVDTADVLVENMRPPVKERLGFDFDAVHARNPRLVYGSLSGFGQDGPYGGRGGVDQIAQGMGGLMSVTGLPGTGPTRAGIPVSDLAAGLHLAIGVLVALHDRDRTGTGHWVQTSLLESMIAMMDFQAARWTIDRQVPGQAGNHHPARIPMGCFATADGHVNIGAAGGRLLDAFCSVIGLPWLPGDARFDSLEKRSANRAELNALVAGRLRTRTTAAWVSALNDAGVPCGPVYQMNEVFADPQVQHLAMTQTVQHPVLGPLAVVRNPVRISGGPDTVRTPSPDLGDHTDEVLTGLGYSPAEIGRLRAQAVI